MLYIFSEFPHWYLGKYSLLRVPKKLMEWLLFSCWTMGRVLCNVNDLKSSKYDLVDCQNLGCYLAHRLKFWTTHIRVSQKSVSPNAFIIYFWWLFLTIGHLSSSLYIVCAGSYVYAWESVCVWRVVGKYLEICGWLKVQVNVEWCNPKLNNFVIFYYVNTQKAYIGIMNNYV